MMGWPSFNDRKCLFEGVSYHTIRPRNKTITSFATRAVDRRKRKIELFTEDFDRRHQKEGDKEGEGEGEGGLEERDTMGRV